MKAKTIKLLALISLLGVLVFAVTVEPVETKITPADGAASDYFGDSVAMDGDTLVVGASQKDAAYQDAGAAYVYVHGDSGWVQQQELLNSQTDGFLFGSAVGVSGDTLVVGCPYNYTGDLALGGAAFIYVRNANQWSLQQIVTSPAAYDGDGFGRALSLSGDTLVVGAPPDMSWFSSGAAYVFVRQGTTWTLQQTLVGDDSQAGALVGVAIALGTNFVAVGAIGDGSAPGAAYLFTRSGSVWTQLQKLTASDGAPDDGFGLSLGLSRDALVVGAPRNSTRGQNMGAAYVFAQTGTTWTEVQKLEDSVGEPFDQFGHAVAVSSDKLVVGSVSGNTTVVDTGSADVYTRSNNVWSLRQKLAPVDLRAQDVFGHSLAISGSRLAVSALQYFNFNPGAVYVYQLEVPDTTPPVLECSPAQTASADASGKATLPDFASLATATDDRTPTAQLLRTQSPLAGTSLGLGSYTVTVQVADAAGNVSSCTSSFTVVDTTPPSASLPQRFTASANENCQAAVPNVLPNLIASDNCTASDALVKSQQPAAGTLVNSGSTTITVTVTDASGNSNTATTLLVVSDTTPPVVVAPGPRTSSANSQGKALVPDFLTGLVASDNCTPAGSLQKAQNPAAGSLVGLGSTVVTITVTDTAGNSASANTSFTVVDTTAPVIISVQALSASADSNGQAPVPDFLAGLVASDNCTPAASLLKSQQPAAGTLVGVGSTVVTVTVTDAAGNAATTSTSFTVVDTTPPSVIAPASVTVASNSSGQAVVPDILSQLVVSDNVTPANALTKVQSPAAGTLVSGQTIIQVTVTDAAGNSATASTTLILKDTTPPVIASASVSPSLIDKVNGKLVPVTVTVSVSDNSDPAPTCRILCITSDQTTQNHTEVDWEITGDLTATVRAEQNGKDPRTYTLKLICTDASGNSSTASVYVIVDRNGSTLVAPLLKSKPLKK